MLSSEDLYQTANDAIRRATESLERCKIGMMQLRQEQSKREELLSVAALTRQLVNNQNEKLHSNEAS